MAKGKCKYCGKYDPIKGRVQCIKCYLKGAAGRAIGDQNRWHALLDMFEQAKCRCAYSGILLTLGVNTQIDHIIPRSKGGRDSITNVHWVHEDVNQMKKDLMPDRFLDLVKAIHDNMTKGSDL